MLRWVEAIEVKTFGPKSVERRSWELGRTVVGSAVVVVVVPICCWSVGNGNEPKGC